MEGMNFERVIRKAITDEIKSYADIIAEDLSNKYKAEFEKSLSMKKAEIVARVAESIMIATQENPMTLQRDITIQMKH